MVSRGLAPPFFSYNVGLDFGGRALGIIDRNFGVFDQQISTDIDTGGLWSVVGVFLEGKIQEGDFLSATVLKSSSTIRWAKLGNYKVLPARAAPPRNGLGEAPKAS